MITADKVEKIVTSKEHNTRLCILTSRFYDSSLAYFLFLFELAKKDFPELKAKDCQVRQYQGRFRKGMCGLEFQVISETISEEYKEWSDHCVNTYFPT